MAIQRWDPLRDLVDLQDRIRHLFDEALSRSGGADDTESVGGGFRPPIDLHEESERFVVRADLPGVAPTEVELAVEEGTLVLRGERRPSPGVAREAYLRVERPHGRFSVRLQLPPSVDAAGIQAVHRNGVIEVVLPKRKPASPSRIEVAPS